VIELWAPHAQSVDIVWLEPELVEEGSTSFRTRAMERADSGWWRWEPTGPDEGAGTAYPIDYAFRFDGDDTGAPFPDPRSAWQPYDVHGPSRTFDATTFPWTDAGWRGPQGGAGVLGGLVYELHVGTFTPAGTFEAAIERLDHLVALGVATVEVMLVAAFPGAWGWGYDGVDLYAVHDQYGGPEAFQRFVDACHARGLGVCLDVVYNHVGPSGNYLARFGPYFTQAHLTPWGPAVNFDHDGSEEVRRFVIENALRWFRDFHVDALRLDAVHEIKDSSARHILAELSDEVAALSRTLDRPLALIAESDLNDTVMVTPVEQGGRGMTAQWDDDIHHGLHVALSGETQGYYADFAGRGRTLPDGGPLAVLAKVLTEGFLHDGSWSSFRGRDWGAPIDREGLDGRRLLGYLQTHDQVGNRAAGDRIGATVPAGRLAAGAALALLGAATPMVFMGEEWSASTPWAFFTSFPDETMAEAVRTGRRAEFAEHGWAPEDIPDPQDPATRDACVLAWDELARPEHERMFAWYAALARLRAAHLSGPTRFADVRVDVDEDCGWLVMRHRDLVVAVNLGAEVAEIPMPEGASGVLSWVADGTEPAGSAGGVRLRADECAVLVVGS
jgi:maltooligosyltrehalose trehalohydrolase